VLKFLQLFYHRSLRLLVTQIDNNLIFAIAATRTDNLEFAETPYLRHPRQKFLGDAQNVLYIWVGHMNINPFVYVSIFVLKMIKRVPEYALGS
jgi:hypothetical protein